MLISRELSVYDFTRNRSAVMAPTKPPIYENTAEIFWTCLLMTIELADLERATLAKIYS
jgi:hypothetical protein